MFAQIVDNKTVMGVALKEANFSLAGVYYAAGDNIKYQVSEMHASGKNTRSQNRQVQFHRVRAPVFMSCEL